MFYLGLGSRDPNSTALIFFGPRFGPFFRSLFQSFFWNCWLLFHPIQEVHAYVLSKWTFGPFFQPFFGPIFNAIESPPGTGRHPTAAPLPLSPYLTNSWNFVLFVPATRTVTWRPPRYRRPICRIPIAETFVPVLPEGYPLESAATFAANLRLNIQPQIGCNLF